MDPELSLPICRSFEVYRKALEKTPRPALSGVWGSLEKCLECGCEYCSLSCILVGKEDELKQNKERNQDAFVENSGLSFSVGNETTLSEDFTLNGQLNRSGLSFKTGQSFKGISSATEVFVMDRADDPVLPVATPISGYTGSDQALRTAWKWFETCVKEHDGLCPRLVTSDGPLKLPTRVLDVTKSVSRSVRLLETEGKVGYWACLSHSWGGEQPLITTNDTIASHLENIPWESLPKTFQDAVFVARAFEIQYLWIDSLCIIQDDVDDWQVESSHMADIYHNAILTIAGSASSGPHQGIFRKSHPAHVDSPLSETSGNRSFKKFRRRKPLVHDPAQLPLLSRGWVHQERLLSSRFLHFGQNELVWECMESLTCECGALHLTAASSGAWLAPKRSIHPYSLQFVDWMKRLGPPVWHAVVSDYSRMALTKQDDIFPAVSGLAKSVIKSTGWEYVAGLWKENMITDLVWYTSDPQLASRCVPWRAPTFSWASIKNNICDGTNRFSSPINYGKMDILRQGLKGSPDPRRTTSSYATLVEASCTPVANDLTGRLVSGYIVMRGTLIKTALYRSEPDGKWHITARGKSPHRQNNFKMDYALNQDATLIWSRSGKVHCLRLIGTKKNVEYEDEEFLVYLVLRQVQMIPVEFGTHGGETGSFERIGLLTNEHGEIQLEDESEPSDILRDVLVKIV